MKYPDMDCTNPIAINEWNNFSWSINVNIMLGFHRVRLVNGEGILFNHPNQKWLKIIQKWYIKVKFKEKMDKLEFIISTQGKGIMIWYLTKSNEIGVDVSNWMLLGRDSKVSEQEQTADLWLMPDQTDNGSLTHIEITPNIMIITKYSNDNKVRSGSVVSEIQKDLQPIERQIFKNKLGTIPFFEIMNQPFPLFTGNSTTLNLYPTLYPCYRLQWELEESIEIRSKERKFNRTRGYGLMTSEQLDMIKNSKSDIANLTDDFFLGAGTNNYAKDSTTGINFLQGKPLLSEYSSEQKDILNQIYNTVHLSSPYDTNSGGSYENKTRSLISKTKDLETQSWLQGLRIPYYNRIFESVLRNAGASEEDIDLLSWDFMDCGLVDQMMLDELVTSRINNGTIRKAKAIMKYDKLTLQEAERELELINEEKNSEIQKQLLINKFLDYDKKEKNKKEKKGIMED